MPGGSRPSAARTGAGSPADGGTRFTTTRPSSSGASPHAGGLEQTAPAAWAKVAPGRAEEMNGARCGRVQLREGVHMGCVCLRVSPTVSHTCRSLPHALTITPDHVATKVCDQGGPQSGDAGRRVVGSGRPSGGTHWFSRQLSRPKERQAHWGLQTLVSPCRAREESPWEATVCVGACAEGGQAGWVVRRARRRSGGVAEGARRAWASSFFSGCLRLSVSPSLHVASSRRLSAPPPD